MRRAKPVSVKVIAPSRGVITRWPSQSADMLATGEQRFLLPGFVKRASTVGSNVRYEDGMIKRAPGYSRVQTPSNILAHWPLDEASGTRFDISGNGLDLTVAGGLPAVGQSAGKFNFAANFPPLNGIDWDAVVWTLVSNVAASGGGTASGVYAGSQLSVSSSWASGSESSYSRALGTVNYSGPSATCNVHVVTTAGDGSSAAMGFFVQQDGVSVITVNGGNIGTPGTYDFQFTIASTAGSVITIIGLTDISQPSRAFIMSTPGNPLRAYSAVFSNL